MDAVGSPTRSQMILQLGAGDMSATRMIVAADHRRLASGFFSSSSDLINLEIADDALWVAPLGENYGRRQRLGSFPMTAPRAVQQSPLNAHLILLEFDREALTCTVTTDTGIDRQLSATYCNPRVIHTAVLGLQTRLEPDFSGLAPPFMCLQLAHVAHFAAES